MNASRSLTSADRLTIVLALAKLLERFERSSTSVDADQYRAVVQRLSDQLQQAAPEQWLGAVLDAHPAAAQLYENLNYAHAGLCRSALDHSLATEALARQAIDRARRVA